MGRFCPLAIAVSALLAASAHAQNALELSVAYRAAEGCPAADDFVAAVTARAPGTVLTPLGGDNEASLVVRIAEVGGEFRGSLAFRSHGHAVREIHGSSCADVVTAMAIAVALSIADERDAPPATAAPTEDVDGETPPALSESTPSPASQPASANRGDLDPPRLSAGAALVTETGLLPDAHLAVPIFAELALRRGHVLLRISGRRVRSSVADQMGGAADFTLMAAGAELCSPFLRPTGTLFVGPCAAVEAGRLSTTGRDVDQPESSVRPHLSGGAAARLSWWLHRRLAIQVDAGVDFAVIRDRYYFAPTATIHRTPAASVRASLGAAVAIW